MGKKKKISYQKKKKKETETHNTLLFSDRHPCFCLKARWDILQGVSSLGV